MREERYPLVSIVLTTYKGMDCVRRCLESAYNQEYPNIEIVIVDDNGKGTEDQENTYKEISDYLIHKNIIYVAHKKNSNGSVARNTGIKMASGEYIAFLDDDDVLYQDSISQRVEALLRKDASYAFVLTSYRTIRAGFLDEDVILDFDGNILEDYLKKKYQSPSTVILAKKNAIEKIGFWDETFLRHQDWEFLARMSCMFKGCSVKKVTVDKYVLQRNYPTNPDVFRDRRLHYLNTVKKCMANLSPKVQKEILYLHYYDIAKEYFKGRKIIQCFKWCAKSGDFIRAIISILKDGFSFLTKKTQRGAL